MPEIETRGAVFILQVQDNNIPRGKLPVQVFPVIGLDTFPQDLQPAGEAFRGVAILGQARNVFLVSPPVSRALAGNTAKKSLVEDFYGTGRVSDPRKHKGQDLIR